MQWQWRSHKKQYVCVLSFFHFCIFPLLCKEARKLENWCFSFRKKTFLTFSTFVLIIQINIKGLEQCTSSFHLYCILLWINISWHFITLSKQWFSISHPLWMKINNLCLRSNPKYNSCLRYNPHFNPLETWYDGQSHALWMTLY